MITLRKVLTFAAVATVAISLTACSEDSTSTPTPPTLDAQFLGYSDPTTQQTTCGNCHVEKQGTWETTRHASAWNDLQASGHAGSTCYPCHTVSGSSNAAPDENGFPAVDTSAQKFYYDVQCESCHGPGAAHIAGPETTQPIATIIADTGATTGCATCHNGSHHPFVEEWRQSRHAIADPHMTGSASCQRCHEGRAALAAMDPDADYLERTAGPAQPTTCAVCHDPHGSDNPADLRLSVDAQDLATNLCMSCHNRRAAPTSTSSSPHGPQGATLLGTMGWIPAGFTYDTSLIESSHGSSANPGLCAGCHVQSYTVNDAVSGAFLMTATGHRFLAIPCKDANGAPDSAQACGYSDLSLRRFGSCTTTGCHASESSARAAFYTVKARTANYVATLWIDVDGDQVIDAFPADSGLLPKVKQLVPSGATACSTSDPTISVCDGAEFNIRVLGEAMSSHPDGSFGTHNPFYTEALLIATINSVRSTYGLPAPPAERTAFAARMAALGMNR